MSDSETFLRGENYRMKVVSIFEYLRKQEDSFAGDSDSEQQVEQRNDRKEVQKEPLLEVGFAVRHSIGDDDTIFFSGDKKLETHVHNEHENRGHFDHPQRRAAIDERETQVERYHHQQVDRDSQVED